MNFKRILGALALIAFTAAAAAQSWPTKPIRVVVPFPPGGPLDGAARALGSVVSQKLGQPVVVDNRPGALGTIGTEMVARAPADGYTVLAGFSGGHSVTPAIMNLRFDPLKDLPPLIGVARSEMVLVTGAANKGVSLQEFIKSAKGKDLSMGGIGTGSTNHLVGEVFKRTAGLRAVHVPYQGAAPLSVAVMAGEVDLAVLDVGAVLANVQSGKIVPLAVASLKRSEFLPAVPTFAEAGFPYVVAENVYGIFLPAGVPKAIREKLYGAFAGAATSPGVKEQLAKMGLVATVLPESTLESVITRQAASLATVARELKIRIE